MARARGGRILLGIGVAAVALLAATAAGAALFGALLGLVGGAVAALVVAGAFGGEEQPVPEEQAPADPLARAREVLEALPDPMLLLDGGHVALANARARVLFGDWAEGQDVRLALRHPAALERLASVGDGQIERLEVVGIGDAERRWLLAIAPLSEGWRLIHLSDRSEAAAAEQMRVDFVANASHELRTPLATLLGFIETLRDDEAASDRDLRQRFLGIMNDEAKRMQQLIDDLITLSRVEAERFRPVHEPVDLLPLVEEVRSGCALLLAERKNRLVIESPDGGASVPGDRTQLLQLVRNLIVNAVKYGRPGTDVTVTIEAEGEDRLRLSVADRGEGIAPEHLPRLTERFYRVDAGRSRAAGGTGLGLAIVKHIVGRHRGRLEIKSQLGSGTRVDVTLPKAAVPDAPPVVTSLSS
ncbi:MAG TPA: ATP-binding protein [Allosphingosinicella sp.]|jgi:two-component system phosphate regulon sensor histidine kinase PhoR